MNELTELFTNFEWINWQYVIICNLLTYMVIKTIESIRSSRLKKGWRRIISVLSGLILAIIMIEFFKFDSLNIFYGFFVQFLTWDYAFKPLVKKIFKKGIDEKH